MIKDSINQDLRVAWLSWLERCVHIAEVTGSNPVATTKYNAEPWCSRLTCQPVTLEIAGSIPVGSAIRIYPLNRAVFLCLNSLNGNIRPAGILQIMTV